MQPLGGESRALPSPLARTNPGGRAKTVSVCLQRMWACPFTRDYGMFVAVAMLGQHRQTLMGLRTFEQLMQVREEGITKQQSENKYEFSLCICTGHIHSVRCAASTAGPEVSTDTPAAGQSRRDVPTGAQGSKIGRATSVTLQPTPFPSGGRLQSPLPSPPPPPPSRC